MPFLDFENSREQGEPVHLYEFRRGTMRLLYANADRDITAGSDTFIATQISDEGNKQKGDAVTDAFNLTVPYEAEIAAWFRFTPPSDLVYLVVRRFHYGDLASVIVWIGTVISTTTNPDGTVNIACHAVSISLRRAGLRMAWQRGCPHALYDQNCRASKELFKWEGVVQLLGANYIQTTEFPPGSAHWPGGFIEWNLNSGTIERRLIFDVSGRRFIPFGDLDGYTVGQTLRFYPGCLRTSFWCDSFFANIDNYGGFPFMPNRTPYDGDPVF